MSANSLLSSVSFGGILNATLELLVVLPLLTPLADENGYLRHGTISTEYIQLQWSETLSQRMFV